jgi:quercetin dioxygenase-like cupin family protein
MLYRDLIPDRQGGRFIASHIRITEGGPVPDYVHFHRVRFQMIYCHRGWARLVYEDQGPPFVFHAGDCVLQPPKIRHRVLEASPGMEVVEISCPAEHETLADLEMELPTAARRPDRSFGGQRFVRHEAATAVWRPWRGAGFESRDLGIAAATEGLASAHVVRVGSGGASSPAGIGASIALRHEGELLFTFVLGSTVALESEGRDRQDLQEGDAFVVPTGHDGRLVAPSDDLQLLQVALPAAGLA